VFAFLKRQDREASKFKVTDTDSKKMQIRIEQLKKRKEPVFLSQNTFELPSELYKYEIQSTKFETMSKNAMIKTVFSN